VQEFFDANYGGKDYDPIYAREGAEVVGKDNPVPESASLPGNRWRSRWAVSLGCSRWEIWDVLWGAQSSRSQGLEEDRMYKQVTWTAIAQNGWRGQSTGSEIAELNQQLMEIRMTVEGLEKERDFYFGKLRKIEVLCQENEGDNHPALGLIMDELYATEDGFAAPDDDGIDDLGQDDEY
ncbi:Microtubule-associated protein RP/EB member 2, partial [Branchiostoma belcheri]